MWFKNLIIYRLAEPLGEITDNLQEQLTAASFRPCGKHELSSYGWTSPMGDQSDLLFHASSGFILLTAKKEERILPASVIREFLDEKVRAIEEEQSRKVRKKERDEMRDEIIFELLPKAFTRSSRTNALIMPQQNLLLIDSASAKKADELTSHLHKTVSDIHLQPMQVKHAPASLLTHWLKGEASPPDHLTLGDECELTEPGEEGGIARCRRQDLSSQEIKAHLDAGKQAVKLGLEWEEKISFLFCDDFSIKKLRYADALQEQISDMGDLDAGAQFDAEFTLMSLELAQFIPQMIENFGGAVTPT